MSTGSEDRDCIALDLKLFCLSFLPIILITVLQRENNAVQEAGRNYILMIALNQVYIVKKKQKQVLTSLRLKAFTLDWMKKG